MSKHYLAILFVCVITTCSFGQTDDCEVTLIKATDEYNAGHFLGIDSLLANCMKAGFTREQHQRADLLLTHVYLLVDNPEMAEATYLNLLKANPEFKTDPARDPIEVVYLSKKFTSAPIFSIYGKIGGNVSFADLIKAIPLTGKDVVTKYAAKPGWNVSIGGEFHATERLSIGTELELAFTSYKRTQTYLWTTSSTEFTDRQIWGKLPVYVKYTLKGKSLAPYAYGGMSLNLLLSDRANPSLFNKSSPDSESETRSESPVGNYNDYRDFFSKSIFAGVGVQYKWQLSYLFADARYSFGMDKLLAYQFQNSTDSFNHTEYSAASLFNYGHEDDFFRLNNVYLTIGYRHPLYKPRKLKKARTKSVVRGIEKQQNAQ